MIRPNIKQLLPAFLLADKNGFAMAAALETGLNIFCQVLQDGIDTVLATDKMPEWRLDEMAWELDCLYDYSADIQNKRAWIRDAIPLYASYGTLEAIRLYLQGYFTGVEVEEGWQYGGEAYHFRVTATGEWTEEKEKWARKAIESTKNVRSVLDSLAAGSDGEILVGVSVSWKRFYYSYSGPDSKTGITPFDALVAALTADKLTVSGEATGKTYQYRMTGPDGKAGTMPVEATIGATAAGGVAAKAEGKGTNFPYLITGTIPQESTVSAQRSAAAMAHSDGAGAVFSYPLCGDNQI